MRESSMRTAPVKAIALPALYIANLSFNRHVPFPAVAHARTPRVLHFSILHSLLDEC